MYYAVVTLSVLNSLFLCLIRPGMQKIALYRLNTPTLRLGKVLHFAPKFLIPHFPGGTEIITYQREFVVFYVKYKQEKIDNNCINAIVRNDWQLDGKKTELNLDYYYDYCIWP